MTALALLILAGSVMLIWAGWSNQSIPDALRQALSGTKKP